VTKTDFEKRFKVSTVHAAQLESMAASKIIASCGTPTFTVSILCTAARNRSTAGFAPPTKLALNPKIFLAHGETERAGGKRERDENADGHMVQHRLDAADAEPGRADRSEQDDSQRGAAPEPALD
jgi:hypothetical protein